MLPMSDRYWASGRRFGKTEVNLQCLAFAKTTTSITTPQLHCPGITVSYPRLHTAPGGCSLVLDHVFPYSTVYIFVLPALLALLVHIGRSPVQDLLT